MKSCNTYLNFDGNTAEAMKFYQGCLGAELKMQTFGEAQPGTAPGAENRIMHAHLSKGPMVLMASDTMPGMTFKPGNNFAVSIDCDDVPEIEKLFAAFSAGGTVTMPLQDTFWGARFGMLNDKFGIAWMFNCELPKKA